MEEVTENTVRVRFLASPINPSDLNQIEGTYPIKPIKLPAVGGNEGIARVEAVGQNVSMLQEGDLVIPGGKSVLGCWRDFACLRAEDLIKIPEKWSKLPLEVLATINVNPPTAFRLLRDFVSLHQGDLVVQNGANSAVGRLIIQMASFMGVRTLNIIRDRPDFDALAGELRQLDPNGNATVIKADDVKNITGITAKLGLNCVGGGAVADMSKVMADDGVIVTFGGMSRRPVIIPSGPFIFKNLTLKHFWLTAWYKKLQPHSPERAQMLENILSLYSSGQLKPVKSFWLAVDESADSVQQFVKDSVEGKLDEKGKCILRFT